MNKVRKVCKYCGSTDVLKDAWAEWDEEKQEWVLSDVYDDDFCVVCDDETTINDEDITGPTTS